MARAIKARGYKPARSFRLRKGAFAWTADFVCPVDQQRVQTRMAKVVDEAGVVFPGAVCPLCRSTVLFVDRHGNSVRWPSQDVEDGQEDAP